MAAQEFQCEVKSIRMLTPTVFELAFQTNRPFEFIGGQFASIVIPGAGPKGRDLRRAYSIASTPGGSPVELCIKRVESGPGSQYLYALKPGQVFRAFAPYGDFIYKKRSGRRVCFIATGTGVAPFRSITQSKDFQASLPISTLCLFGVREESELLYMDDFAKLPFVTWVPMLSQPRTENWNGRLGRVTNYLREQGAKFPWLETDYYLCGSGAMIDEVKLILMGKGVTKDSIHQEIYYKPAKADGSEKV